MIEAVIGRLKEQVPDLNDRVEEAAYLADLLKTGRVDRDNVAIVVPSALQGGRADTGTGVFSQGVTETIAVVLITPSHDRNHKVARNRMRPLSRAVITALVGWRPGDELGVFALRQGRIFSVAAGRLVFQIEFSIEDQLRVSS